MLGNQGISFLDASFNKRLTNETNTLGIGKVLDPGVCIIYLIVCKENIDGIKQLIPCPYTVLKRLSACM